MTTVDVRGPERRKRERLDRLEREADIWVASADPDGLPCLVPLSFLWDGAEFGWPPAPPIPPAATCAPSPGPALLADTRDMVLLEGTVGPVPQDAVPLATADVSAAKAK